MWPQTLQMSEDDCRSKLRRLELETYANVIGVFRAQGGLSEKKVKLLEELRNVFHISQDRHRAEARRVANDEYLSTIAKVVSGPNTWQEWSREGRRSYPMLPRVAPHTALGWIANNLAAEAALENAKLPYPADTSAAATEEQAASKAASDAIEAAGYRYHEKYVVTSDPFKLPDIPVIGAKKNLKRNISDSHHTGIIKKRNLNEMPVLHKQKHITATSLSTSPNTSGNRRSISNAILQQQRFFYQQQQKAKKLAKAASKREKLPRTGKLGRKPKKVKEQELRQQREREQQEQMLQQQELAEGAYEHQFMQRLDHSDYTLSTNVANVVIDMGNQGQSQQHSVDIETQFLPTNQKTLYMPMTVPQIAASKRDITQNLTKLQIPAQISTSPTAQITKLDTTSISSRMSPAQSTPTIVIGGKTSADCKLTSLSTPVQKYIVEDRQPQIASASTSALPPPLMGQQATTSQFVGALSQGKMRPVNTTILPPGTKISTAKKLSSGNVLSATVVSPTSCGNSTSLLDNIMGNPSTSTQLLNLVDSANVNQSNISTQQQQQQLLSQPTAPTHAPPAVIQLHNNEVLRMGAAQSNLGNSGTTSTQSKVLTTKILPIVLSSNSAKADTIKNGSASIVSVSSSNFVTNSSGATIIKSLPASLLVSGQHGTSASGSTVFSTFGSSGSVYRKHPNILRSSSTSTARLQNSGTKSGGPQIISNIRLTPAITSTSSTNNTFAGNSTQTSIFQRNVPSTSTGIRTSVKICQSPNGKVFIQPANAESFKLGKLSSSHISQRLIPSTILGGNATSNLNIGTSGNTSGTSGTLSNKPGSPRIAIQKVQIIPAQLSGTTFSNTSNLSQQQQQTQQQRFAGTTLALGGNTKGNIASNLFIQGRNSTTGSAITLTKATTGSPTDNCGGTKGITKTSNVVVIDSAGAVNKFLPQQTKISALCTSSNISRSNIVNNQMITEDTPVDIIDIVDSPTETRAVSPTSANEKTSITAVLTRNILTESKQHQNEPQQEFLATQKQTIITSLSPTPTAMVPITMLSATDWEMELDQAKAASKTHQQADIADTNAQQRNQLEEIETADTIIIDDSFEDVIIEEEEQEDTTATESEQYDSEDQQQRTEQENYDNTENQHFSGEEKNVNSVTETNYENVPMCIEESIETTHIDGGNGNKLNECDADVDVMSTPANDISFVENFEKADEKDFNTNEDEQKSNSILDVQHYENADNEISLRKSIETDIKQTNLLTTPKTQSVALNNKLQEGNSILGTTTKISASLVTVKKNLESESNTQNTFDVTDEAKSNQGDAINAQMEQ